MSITFKFTNRNLNEDGIRVWRSATPFDKDTLPESTHDELPAGTKTYEDTFVARGDEYYYLFETYRGNDSAFSNLMFAEALPILTGPGPQSLLVGDHRTGFYGETLVEDLINSVDLAAAINLTEGFAMYSAEPWLKFNQDGKTLFVSKKPMRRNVSWDAISAANAVYGGESGSVITTAQGDQFRVRLLTGGNGDPSTAAGGEWNRLLYPVHIEDPNGTGWGIGYTNADLILDQEHPYGRASWTQETPAADVNDRVTRGNSGLTNYWVAAISSSTSDAFGWRPVLEFIA